MIRFCNDNMLYLHQERKHHAASKVVKGAGLLLFRLDG